MNAIAGRLSLCVISLQATPRSQLKLVPLATEELGPAKLHKQGPEPRRPRTTAKTHSSLPSPVIVSVSALESFCSAARPSEAGLGSVHREAGMELIIIHIHLVGDSRLLLMEVVL